MSSQNKSQNDYAWEALFEKYDILSHIDREGKFIISAAQIKEYREPRLMAKFDHRINLPQVFAKNRLAILPISRGNYAISHFEAYRAFEDLDKSITRVFLPEFIQSLDSNSISSEAIAINCALASGMLSDFLEEEILYSTVSGRMGSGRFDFNIYNSQTKAPTLLTVNNSQIEIDAAFEGIQSLALIEAKLVLADDFLVRQLYYPYRVWNHRITKKIKPVFLVYSNGIYSLYEYSFSEEKDYNSLSLIKHRNYSIEDTAIRLSDLQDVNNNTEIVTEPEVSFPQANSFERVINLCELLNSSQALSREQVTERYAFDIRQTNYYTDAARYLGLLDKYTDSANRVMYSLSVLGKQIMKQSYKNRQLAYCKAILQHRVFKTVFEMYMKAGRMPDTSTVVGVMKESGLYNVGSMSTYERRASTVNGWINWMLDLVEE